MHYVTHNVCSVHYVTRNVYSVHYVTHNVYSVHYVTHNVYSVHYVTLKQGLRRVLIYLSIELKFFPVDNKNDSTSTVELPPVQDFSYFCVCQYAVTCLQKRSDFLLT